MTRRKTTRVRASSRPLRKSFPTIDPEAVAFIPPYPPSWIDRLTDAVDRLPGPAWLAYFVMGAAVVVVQVAVQLSGGDYYPGPLLPFHIWLFASPAYLLAMIHYLDRSANLALGTFRPVLQLSSSVGQASEQHTTYAELRYRLTTLPARTTAWVAILGGLLNSSIPVLVFQDPSGERISVGQLSLPFHTFRLSTAPLPIAVMLLETFLATAITAALVYHTIHQLRLIQHIYANHTRLNLYRLQPLYAFSAPAALTSGGFLVYIYAFVTIGPGMVRQPSTLAVLTTLAAVAVVTFVLPLWGIHRRLVQEKKRLMAQSSEWFERTVADLHHRLGRPRLTGMDELNKALASLELEQAALRRIPTWPWEPGTLRGLIVALLLPIIIWLVQFGLQRLLG